MLTLATEGVAVLFLSPRHHTGLITGPGSPVRKTSSVRPKPRIAQPVGAGFAQRAATMFCGLFS